MSNKPSYDKRKNSFLSFFKKDTSPSSTVKPSTSSSFSSLNSYGIICPEIDEQEQSLCISIELDALFNLLELSIPKVKHLVIQVIKSLFRAKDGKVYLRPDGWNAFSEFLKIDQEQVLRDVTICLVILSTRNEHHDSIITYIGFDVLVHLANSSYVDVQLHALTVISCLFLNEKYRHSLITLDLLESLISSAVSSSNFRVKCSILNVISNVCLGGDSFVEQICKHGGLELLRSCIAQCYRFDTGSKDYIRNSISSELDINNNQDVKITLNEFQLLKISLYVIANMTLSRDTTILRLIDSRIGCLTLVRLLLAVNSSEHIDVQKSLLLAIGNLAMLEEHIETFLSSRLLPTMKVLLDTSKDENLLLTLVIAVYSIAQHEKGEEALLSADFVVSLLEVAQRYLNNINKDLVSHISEVLKRIDSSALLALKNEGENGNKASSPPPPVSPSSSPPSKKIIFPSSEALGPISLVISEMGRDEFNFSTKISLSDHKRRVNQLIEVSKLDAQNQILSSVRDKDRTTISILLLLLCSNGGNERLRENILNALVAISEHPEFSSSDIELQHSVISELIDLLSCDYPIAYRTCSIIHGFVRGNLTICQQLYKAGVLIRLVFILNLNSSDLKLKCCVAHALTAFCSISEECQNKVAQLGGVVPLVSLLELANSDQIKRTGCIAIAALVKSNGNLQNQVKKINGAIERIIQNLLSKDVQLKSNTCECLMELAKDNAKIIERICNAGAPQLFVNILSSSSSSNDFNETLLYNCLAVISVLLQKKSARKLFASIDLVGSVEPLLGRNGPSSRVKSLVSNILLAMKRNYS